jgi:ketosteroid isomerase-like protein
LDRGLEMNGWGRFWVKATGVIAILLVVSVRPFGASAQDLQADGAQAVAAWVGAVASGDKDAVAAILAPEYQIVRDNGVAYDRAAYLASALPKIEGNPHFDELIATAFGDVMVVRYLLVVDETIGGATVETRAPRLTVFRRDGDRWLVTAHANFAVVGK